MSSIAASIENLDEIDELLNSSNDGGTKFVQMSDDNTVVSVSCIKKAGNWLVQFLDSNNGIVTISFDDQCHIEELDKTLGENNPFLNVIQDYEELFDKQNAIILENTIDAEDILLEREIITEYQSKIKPFMQKGKKKIRF